MTQSYSFVRYLLLFLVIVSCRTAACAQGAGAKDQPLHPDSLRAEILQLRTDLDATRTNLRTSHRKFRTGILVSGIGYTITIIGGVLLGSSEYSDWGQPLVIAGGAVGFSGALLLLNSNRFIGRAGGDALSNATQKGSLLPTTTERRAP